MHISLMNKLTNKLTKQRTQRINPQENLRTEYLRKRPSLSFHRLLIKTLTCNCILIIGIAGTLFAFTDTIWADEAHPTNELRQSKERLLHDEEIQPEMAPLLTPTSTKFDETITSVRLVSSPQISTVSPSIQDHTNITNTALSPTVSSSTAASVKPVLGQDDCQKKSYTVQPGDTLFQIARMHGISATVVQQCNQLSSAVVTVGAQLHLPAIERDRSSSPDRRAIGEHSN